MTFPAIGPFTKALRIMKLISILMIAACLQVTAKGYSQITLDETNAPLQKVFKEIEKQSGFNVFYTAELLEQQKPVSVSLKNVSLETAMEACLKDRELTYEVIDKTVVIKKKIESKVKIDEIVPPGDIHGHVTDSVGHPLVGASIIVKGSKTGTTTDANGNFTLSGVNDNATLIISYTGYAKQQYKLKGQSSINISLIPYISELDKVQVIAYGTTTQRVYTGDVSVVGAKAIGQQPVSNPLLALEGRVPGLFISQATGLPGSGVTVQIRGNNSIGNGSDPFYVIDGVPYPSQNLPNYGNILGASGGNGTFYGNPLSFINPSDIESITVLKDAVATSIYGSRAAKWSDTNHHKKRQSGTNQSRLQRTAGFRSGSAQIGTDEYAPVLADAS